ncbi:putative sterigmatocystin biosynthesis peroxidase stcC [Paramyrothecium foliicola]|nr:putative sterigmatocystin biosynthesis peroxidase stcC [Paramyrothecium foliicola]
MFAARSALLFTLAVSFQSALAHQAYLKHRTAVRPWEPAGVTDSRAPCPMLNTLANHGYIAHDGRGITIDDIAGGLFDAIHFDREGAKGLAQAAFSLIGNPPRIDLEDLNTPGATEHNASLTREDHASGDSLHLSPERLQALLADSEEDYIDITSLAKGRIRVEALSPPLFGFVKKVSQSEGGSAIMVMSERPVPGKGELKDYREVRASKARMAVWLSDERLPVELGWQRPQSPLYNTTLFTIGDAVAEAQKRIESARDIPLQQEL